MEKIKFGDSETLYPIESIQPVSPHVMQIVFAENMPEEGEYSKPITLYTQGDIEEGTLEGWYTVYSIDEADKTVCLSDDESVYTEPQPQAEPEPDEPYEPTVEELQEEKISTMQAASASTVKSGVDINSEHFSLGMDARLALLSRQHRIDSGETEIDFYPDGEASKYYSAEEMQNIIDTASDFINCHEVYCNELCLWIKTLTDKDEIEAVYYGMDIPKNNRSAVLEDMLPVGDDETGMLPQEGNDDDEPDNDGGEPDNDDTNVGATGELDFGDPADNYEPADEPDPADDGEGEE